MSAARLSTGAPDWVGRTVCVAGIGVSGRAAAGALLRLGAEVTVVDGRSGPDELAHAEALTELGAKVLLGEGERVPHGTQAVVTSPGWRPAAPLLASARRAGVPVLGEVELAWLLRRAGGRSGAPAPWLAVTGTNGKTTTVRMLGAILEAAGYRAAVAGNVGTPLLDVVLADPPYDVIAVELSSFQLHWSDSVEPQAAAVLNIAPDHVDWHGSLAAYAADKARIYRGTATAVFNVDDAWARALAPDRPGTVGFTLGPPEAGQLGMAGDFLVDRAFPGDPADSADSGAVLARADDVRPYAPHNLSNALAAAALARSHGVPARAVAQGLHAFRPDPHRITHVATIDDVAYVDDSKATNPHAAAASLAAYPSVIWVAGGLAKGAAFEDLVAGAGQRLRAVVLVGADRAVIRDALARHAPEVPIVELPEVDTGVMDRAVVEAARRAQPGDTVLLAPGCASWDIFANYGERGDRFAEAVHRLASPRD